MIARTPSPPYYAVIFTSALSDTTQGYQQMAEEMLARAEKQSGFLGFESAREAIGISISYWRDLESIQRWKEDLAHQQAQTMGRDRWYSQFTLRVARVERESSHQRAP